MENTEYDPVFAQRRDSGLRNKKSMSFGFGRLSVVVIIAALACFAIKCEMTTKERDGTIKQMNQEIEDMKNKQIVEKSKYKAEMEALENKHKIAESDYQKKMKDLKKFAVPLSTKTSFYGKLLDLPWPKTLSEQDEKKLMTAFKDQKQGEIKKDSHVN